jgi:Putative transposase DNA-binding domain
MHPVASSVVRLVALGGSVADIVRRACVVTLKYATGAKLASIRLLVEAYRGCVNRYIKVLWALPEAQFGLDANTLSKVPAGRLSERYRSNALKQAIEIVISTRRAAQATGSRTRCPKFTGNLVLDAKFVDVEDKDVNPGNPFDLVVRSSTLEKGNRIVQGCSLSEDQLILWVEIPEPEIPWTPPQDAKTMGADLGMRKLLTVSDDRDRTAFLGREYHALQKLIRRKKAGSKTRNRLLTERDHLIGRALNALPWGHFDVLGVEDLTGITRGKCGFGKKKEFRRQRLPWARRKVLKRISSKAAENRVLVIAVDPRKTSRECPDCGCASALNRRGEQFRCVACGHTEDADGVGAHNICSRTLAILQKRRGWLVSHPDCPNRAYSTTRRSVASRRLKKARWYFCISDGQL